MLEVDFCCFGKVEYILNECPRCEASYITEGVRGLLKVGKGNYCSHFESLNKGCIPLINIGRTVTKNILFLLD